MQAKTREENKFQFVGNWKKEASTEKPLSLVSTFAIIAPEKPHPAESQRD